MNLLLHERSKKRYDQFVASPPQSLIMVAPAGSGKETVLKSLALDILGPQPIGRLFEITPEDGKKSISIDAIRELKMSLRLKSSLQRVVFINQAGQLTLEAQNSILKLLEDTPKNVSFLIAVNKVSDLLETIYSRSVVWHYILPTKDQIRQYFNQYPTSVIDRTLSIAENRVGLIQALLNQDKEHPLLQAIDLAKEILAGNHFERLIKIENLYKDINQSLLLFEALELVCKGALENAALKHNDSLKHWQNRLKIVLQSEELLNANIQPKLVLSRAFLVL
jgi:DNA polymerase III delta prime subunit